MDLITDEEDHTINANRDEVPRPNQLLPNQKPTYYLIDLVWDGRLIVQTSLMTAHFKDH